MLHFLFRRYPADPFAVALTKRAREYGIPLPDVIVPSGQRDIVRDPGVQDAARRLYEKRHSGGANAGQGEVEPDPSQATTHFRLAG
jgi:hypothetical protein